MQVTQLAYFRDRARVVKLVTTGDLKSPAARLAGSSPASGTTIDCNEMSKISTLDVRQEIGFIKISDSFEIKIKQEVDAIGIHKGDSPVIVIDKGEIENLIKALKLANTILDLNED